jgi:hypothetical protein
LGGRQGLDATGDSGTLRGSATIAALTLAASATLVLARTFPIRFEYQPNDLGIVSLSTLDRYPVQQETFWTVFAVAIGSLITWVLSRLLRPPTDRARRRFVLEASGVATLLGALWLPPIAAAALVAFALPLAIWLGSGSDRSETSTVTGASDFGNSSETSPGVARLALLAIAAVALGMLLSPGVWTNAWNVLHDVPDERLTMNHFKFLGEVGQHLAWGNAILDGGLQGRDLFCLYGPLYDVGLAGFWKVVGRSVAGWDLYWSLSRILGFAALLLFGTAVLRRPWLALLLVFLVPWVKLRLGLPLFGLLFLFLSMRSGRRGWSVAAGVAGGTALLYSQEFGVAFLICAATGLAIRRELAPALAFAGGVAAIAAPILGYYAAEGAALPMLRDLVEYPRYLMAGYGKLPFPAAVSELPLVAGEFLSGPSRTLRMGYVVPAVCVAGLLLALPVSELDPRRPLASLREMMDRIARDPVRLTLALTALFGLIAFRSALGRSQLSRTLVILPPMAVLLVAAIDRTLDEWRGGARFIAVAWRLALVALLVVHSGVLEVAKPLSTAWRSLDAVATLVKHGNHPQGSRVVERVTRWVQLNTDPDEPVLFLPNNGAYYFLTDRPSPIRFVMGHQIVTAAHREEVLSGLRAEPPRFIVWDHAALRIDGLDDTQVFGSALLRWIDDHYVEEVRLEQVEVMRLRSDSQDRDS